VSGISSTVEHQLRIDQDRSRYNKNTRVPRATDQRTSSSISTIVDPPLDNTNNSNVSSLLPALRVPSNLSTPRKDTRNGVYLRTETRSAVDATNTSLPSKGNESSNFNWKQRLQLPATTRMVLSRILGSFSGNRSNNSRNGTTNDETGNKLKIIRLVPLSLLSSITRNSQNVSSHLHKILLSRLKNKTNTAELHYNSTPINKMKNSSSLTNGDEQLWSPIALTSSAKSKNKSLEESLNIKNNSSKRLGGTKRYSILTSFGNDNESSNGTYLVYINKNNTVDSNKPNATNKFESNPPKVLDAKAWLPIAQPAKGHSKLFNHSILGEPENPAYSYMVNIRDTDVTSSQLNNTTKNSRKRVYKIKQNNTTLPGKMKSQLPEIHHEDSKLVNTFLASNMQDLRIPSKEYPINASEKIETAQSSGSTISPSETKKWPGGASGIESLDDLILYHTYTNSHNKPNPTAGTPQATPHRPTITMHQQPGGGYVGVIKKPSVTIQNSHWNYEPVTPHPENGGHYPTRPTKPGIVILENRPHTPKPPSNNHYPNHRPTYGGYEPEYSSTEIPSTAMYPVVLITPRPTPSHKPVHPYPSSHGDKDHSYVTYPKPLNCPNIVITTNGNVTTSGKEACSDVNIMITSGVTNNNVVVSGSSNNNETSVTPLSDNMNDVTMTTKPPVVSDAPVMPTTTIFNTVTSAVSSMLSPLQYPVWYFMLAPLMVIMAGGIGIAALLYPWALGWRSIGREGRFEKKAISHPHPKPRRRRSFCNADCFADDVVREAVVAFEHNLNTARFSKYNTNTFGALSRREKTVMNRRKKRNDSLINYYWWWLRSGT